MTICSIKKKENFFIRTLFSKWIIEMRVTSAGGGVGARVTVFPTDQSEAELLYFYSLLFSTMQYCSFQHFWSKKELLTNFRQRIRLLKALSCVSHSLSANYT
jgi:hypothetical protein